ncbi:DUF1837 domain-containing protein [Porifericola rhodea]|uniref:HamA C-terminal domain-containing protein n=1 Tax=Porifericola rhodea TaxID=930972 RepID=UPI002666C7AF|nr:DUF1837 domain-containing protein [Porifericola rhodea]WKN31366.1 DUF1837 domain-containing protein [Porifericola rhodea]
MPRPFKSEKIIEEQISESSLRCYNIGFDQNKFRLKPLLDIIADVIPEFSLGYYEGNSIPITEARRRLREAALRLYTTDKYSKRGEFGEVILHLLLRDFCGTIPLLSKINFKDSTNTTVKGFDGIHIVNEGNAKKLWLGESKLYTSGVSGVKALAEDLKQHLNEDYLRKEFMLVSTKIHGSVPDRDYWLDLMHENNTLDAIFDGICIPMACTYTSPLFKEHSDNTQEYLEAFVSECKSLEQEFKHAKISTSVDIILMLLPIEDKNLLTSGLHDRLKNMQNI